MYTIQTDKHNHKVTIMDTEARRGVTLLNIGDEMAGFLKHLVEDANPPPCEEEGCEKPGVIHYCEDHDL